MVLILVSRALDSRQESHFEAKVRKDGQMMCYLQPVAVAVTEVLVVVVVAVAIVVVLVVVVVA